MAKIHVKNGRRRQQRFDSVPFVVQKEIDILLELVIENKKLLEGKHGPLVTEANKREKVAGDCGSHKKRVWGDVEDSRHMYKQEMCLSETQCPPYCATLKPYF
ncbi:hypothetical protein DPMN_105017 [Dreissena polymorpha]|uniref:Uncharacterized protein n=1 Tax=Dreissena polymorpha TaxID=45954 RepID=A0A9D4HBK0_DREPO|nr:hypothetical protein DPMN_105017 [Dreissena polymorpha]